MIFSIEIIANFVHLNLIAFSRNINNAQGQVCTLFNSNLQPKLLLA